MKKSEAPLTKHTMNLFAGDMEAMQDLHPETGASVIIRKLVHWYVTETKRTGSPVAQVEIEL